MDLQRDGRVQSMGEVDSMVKVLIDLASGLLHQAVPTFDHTSLLGCHIATPTSRSLSRYDRHILIIKPVRCKRGQFRILARSLARSVTLTARLSRSR